MLIDHTDAASGAFAFQPEVPCSVADARGAAMPAWREPDPLVPEFVFIDGCFARFHAPRAKLPLGRGVVLCNPFGHEALGTGRTLRVLAEMLAEAGIPVLRFDYDGTGDSAGASEPGQIPRWVGNIAAAARWLCAHGGADEIILCGVRLGALLALQAVADLPDTIAGIALLAPPVSGRGLLREMTLQRQVTGGASAAPATGDSEFHGFALFPDAIATLQALKLEPLLAALPPMRRLVLGSTPGLRNITWDAMPFEGVGAFMRPAETAGAPLDDYRRLVAWIGQDAQPATRTATLSPVPAMLQLAEADECPVEFGHQQEVFGILSTPRTVQTGPAVVFLNTGTTPHSGHGRLAVTFSRRLAALGIASVRIDARGVGDSRGAPLGPPGGGVNAIKTSPSRAFRPEFEADAGAAIALLAARGHAPIVLFGVCSGAYLAQRVARGAHDTGQTIGGVMMVNLPRFDPPRLRATRDPISDLSDAVSRASIGAIRQWIGPAAKQRLGAARRAMRRAGREAVAVLAGSGIAGRLFNPALRSLHQLARQNIAATLVYDAGDPGLVELASWLPAYPGTAALIAEQELHGASLRIVEDAGHVFAGGGNAELLFTGLMGVAGL